MPLFLSLAFLLFSVPLEEIPCPPCSGTGIAEQRCEPCGGDGQAPCPVCARWIVELVELAGDPANDQPPEQIEKTLGLLTHRRPGWLPCSLACRDGKAVFGAWDCPLCKGDGGAECPRCKAKATVRCAPCAGRGRRKAACRPCAGRGTVSPDEDRPPEACPWCNDKKTRECYACPKKGDVETACLSCMASGRTICGRCQGNGRMMCTQCAGRGCKACRKKGSVTCSVRTRTPECSTCKGKRRLRVPCELCDGSRQMTCSGCALGRWDAWEARARVLAELGRTERARALLAVALERARQRFVRQAGALGGHPERFEALELERAVTLDALEEQAKDL